MKTRTKLLIGLLLVVVTVSACSTQITEVPAMELQGVETTVVQPTVTATKSAPIVLPTLTNTAIATATSTVTLTPTEVAAESTLAPQYVVKQIRLSYDPIVRVSGQIEALVDDSDCEFGGDNNSSEPGRFIHEATNDRMYATTVSCPDGVIFWMPVAQISDESILATTFSGAHGVSGELVSPIYCKYVTQSILKVAFESPGAKYEFSKVETVKVVDDNGVLVAELGVGQGYALTGTTVDGYVETTTITNCSTGIQVERTVVAGIH